MRIIILGGHGFVGKNLVKFLEGSNYEVFPLSRADGLDLTDLSCAKKFFQKIQPNAVFNCAAHVGSLHYVSEFAADVIFDNVQMALNIYKIISDVCPDSKIINPLSNCSYPGEANIHYEPDWWKGEVHDSVYSYGNSKRFIYVISRNYYRQYGIKSINFLVPNTFGPGDYTDPNKTHAINGMIMRMILAHRKGEKKFEIWGTGKPIREWGYIKDIVTLLSKSLAMEAGLISPVNIAQNKGYSIKESAEFIAQAVGFEGKLIFNSKYADGAPIKVLDDEKFRSLFPDYEFYDHMKGIQETVQYYESNLLE